MGGNIPDGIFLGGNFPGGDLMDGNFAGENFPRGVFLEPKITWKMLSVGKKCLRPKNGALNYITVCDPLTFFVRSSVKKTQVYVTAGNT